jgi:hypothetical protein
MNRVVKRLLWLFLPEDSCYPTRRVDWECSDQRTWGRVKSILWIIGAVSIGIAIGNLE